MASNDGAERRHQRELVRAGYAFTLLLTDPDDAFGLPEWPRYFGHAHPAHSTTSHPDATFTTEDFVEWERGIAEARARGPFVCSLLYFVVSGDIPAP